MLKELHLPNCPNQSMNHKESSTTSKVRAVFASAKSTSGKSLNDTLYVGPTVHTPLLDVLLRFRAHKIALTTDIS